MAYTTHGHQIPWTLAELPSPEKVARCGGVNMCRECFREAAGPMLAAIEEREKKPVTDKPLSYPDLARQTVYLYVVEKLDKYGTTEERIKFTRDDVYLVWFSKVLQNWKALVSTTLPDAMYYEVTFNGDLSEIYVDAYKKFENRKYEFADE